MTGGRRISEWTHRSGRGSGALRGDRGLPQGLVACDEGGPGKEAADMRKPGLNFSSSPGSNHSPKHFGQRSRSTPPNVIAWSWPGHTGHFIHYSHIAVHTEGEVAHGDAVDDPIAGEPALTVGARRQGFGPKAIRHSANGHPTVPRRHGTRRPASPVRAGPGSVGRLG